MAAWEIRQKELMDELKAMEDSWGKLYEEQKESKIPAGKGKDMLLLALQIKQRWQEFITKRDRGQIVKDHIPNHMVMVDWKVFEAHVACARDYLEADAYRDTLKHTQKAIEVSCAHEGAWMECVVMNVLNYEKEAWIGLDEESNYLDTATRRAEGMAQLSAVPRDEVVRAFCEVATVQIELDDYQAAIKSARAAVRVEGVRPASRNTARVKLGVALGCLSFTDEALQELEQCERDWTMSVEGTRWNEQEMVTSKRVLDKCLEELRRGQANETADPPLDWKRKFYLSKEYTDMRQTWDRMTAQRPTDPKALLALALRMRQCAEDEMNKSIARPTSDQTTEIARDVDEKLFQARARCACECVEAEEYQDALEHTKCAIELNDAWDDLWREKLVRVVLECEKRAFFALGEFNKYVDVAKRWARGTAELGYSGQALVDELCKISVVQFKNLCDYVGAVATAREAVALDAPPVSRQYARHTLGTALMATGDIREAVREFERCESEWTTWIDGTEMSEEAELAQMRKMLDSNLESCRRRLAVEEANVTGGKEVMEMLMAGCLDDAAAHAYKTFKVALMKADKSESETEAMWLPELAARAFTVVSCFLLDDHRAAERLATVKEAVKLFKRESLDDACPICLQKIDWPRPLKEGTRVTVHGLKNTPQHNGSQGVVKRAPSGPDLRAQVDFRSAAPEEGVLTVEERKAVLRGLQQVDKPIGDTQEVSRAAEASLSVPEGSLDQDAVDEVIRDVIHQGKEIWLHRGGGINQAIAKELARLEASSTTYSLRVRSANLKASVGYVQASRRALVTGCMHVYHARCIKRAIDEGQRTCPVCCDDSHFAETLVMCAQMPSWDRPSYVD